MFRSTSSRKAPGWSEHEWQSFDVRVHSRLSSLSDAELNQVLGHLCRRVMRTYTTGFFLVSRFLPQPKRDEVEAIYAAVRYPDEIVDTFPLSVEQRKERLDAWEQNYAVALKAHSVRESLERGVSAFLAPFVQVVRRHEIPPDYYSSFLAAMRLDIQPRYYETLHDLVESYIYGSAIVVGYFLTYVYGPSEPSRFREAMESARELAIALQLTNFLRDVREDQRRGRCYLPLDMLRQQGIDEPNAFDMHQHGPLLNVIKELADIADSYYRRAEEKLEAYASDCRVAIQACIRVYGQLNERIRCNNQILTMRESVPLWDKWKVLPLSKYWRIPWAYLTS